MKEDIRKYLRITGMQDVFLDTKTPVPLRQGLLPPGKSLINPSD